MLRLTLPHAARFRGLAVALALAACRAGRRLRLQPGQRAARGVADQRGRGDRDRPPRRRRDPARDGRLPRRGPAALRERHRRADRQRLASSAPALDLHRARRAGRQRVRPARRLRLRHPRAARAPRRRGGAGRRARPRGGACHRAARVAAVHALGRRRRWPCCWSASSCPAVQPFGDLANVGLGTAFLQVRSRRRARIRPARRSSTRRRPGGIPPACRASSRRCRVSTRSASAGIPNWLSTHPDPGLARGQGAADRRANVSEGAGRAQPRRVPAARRRHDLRRRSGRGRRARASLPASRSAHGHRLPRGLGGAQLHRSGRRPARRREGADGDAGGRHRPQRVARRRRRAPHEGPRLQARSRARSQPMGGRDAFVGVYTGKAKGVGDVRVRAAHVAVGTPGLHAGRRRARRPTSRASTASSRAALASFRELSPSEAAAIRPNRIGPYVARLGDSWQSIAQRAGGGLVSATRLALMNGFAVNVQPPAGTAAEDRRRRLTPVRRRCRVL